MTHIQEIGARNWYKKTCSVAVANASDMQFGTECFWYPFLATNRTCSIFVPVYGTSYGFVAPISGMCIMGIILVTVTDCVHPSISVY